MRWQSAATSFQGAIVPIKWRQFITPVAGRSHQLVGCFKDKLGLWRAIPYSGKTFSGSSAVQKCGEIAVANGYQAFGVQDGGECYTGPKAHETFNKYGQAKDSDCKNGVGGWYRNNIYSVCKYGTITRFLTCVFFYSLSPGKRSCCASKVRYHCLLIRSFWFRVSRVENSRWISISCIANQAASKN